MPKGTDCRCLLLFLRWILSAALRPAFLGAIVFSLLIAPPVNHVLADNTSPSVVSPQKTPEVSRDVWYYSISNSRFRTEGIVSGPPAPRLSSEDYPQLNLPNPLGESRLTIWVLAQQHVYWGGFVLGVLFLTTVLEVSGLAVRNRRYDNLAHEMLGLIMLALSISAILGGIFLFGLFSLYPDLTKYLFSVFRPVFLIYGLLALIFTALAYIYYYTWQGTSTGGLKWAHASLGVLVNVIGTTIALLANAWSSFMMAPAGVDSAGRFLGNYWNALHTAVWNPFNLHRFVGNIVLGAAVMAAYAAYRSLTAKSSEEKGHFDWMAYVSFLFLVFALFTIPFGGYWLSREIYVYRQQMGITMFGGLLAWLGIILVTLMSALFFGINYYLWQRINSAGGAERYGRYAKYVFLVLTACFMVYVTPHTMVISPKELLEIHGQQHPVLGNYGVESAKSVASNLMMVVTMWSFMVWWRCQNQTAKFPSPTGTVIVTGAFLAGISNILWLGIYGYYVPANIRVGLSVPMVMTTLSLIILGVTIAIMMHRANPERMLTWRTLPFRGYLALFFLAFTITWIMGLGGYRRSSLRLFWHVNEILRDNSPWAFTHTIGFAANVISMNALIFWVGLLFVLWLARLSIATGKK